MSRVGHRIVIPLIELNLPHGRLTLGWNWAEERRAQCLTIEHSADMSEVFEVLVRRNGPLAPHGEQIDLLRYVALQLVQYCKRFLSLSYTPQQPALGFQGKFPRLIPCTLVNGEGTLTKR